MRNIDRGDQFTHQKSHERWLLEDDASENIFAVEAEAVQLVAGDIAFTAYESDTSTQNGKYFEFVLLRDVPSGTSIWFTDNGYRTDTGTFRTAEEFLRWTAQTDLPAGTKVSFLLENDGANAASAEWSNVTYFGTASSVAALNFGNAGDQIHAFVDPVFGTLDSVGGTAIASLDASTGYQSSYTGTGLATLTGLPSGLSVGSTAIAMGNFDNGRYTGSLSGTPEEIRAAVNNVANWTTNNLSMNTPAFTQKFAGDIAEYVEGSTAVAIDVGQDLLLFDDSFNMNNGSLTIAISGGKSAAQDELEIASGGSVTVTSGSVSVNGTVIGTVVGGGAGGSDLIFTFATTGVTAAAVQEVLRSITYRNSSDSPTSAQRTITTTLLDGDFANNNGADTMIVTTAVNVTALPEVAISDVSQKEGNSGTTLLTFTVTRTGGPDAFTVDFATVNGTATAGSDLVAAAGTLSFALGENVKTVTVTVNGDIQLESDENFTVVLSNATAGTAIIDGSASGTILDDDATGDSGDNVLTGTAGDDTFLLQQGGNDTVFGLDGNDGFYFGGAYTSADVVDGGAGARDQIGLQGDYSGGVTLGSINDVELVVMLSGTDARFGDTAGNLYDYRITTTDASLAAGKNLVLQGNTLQAGEDFTFNGSAETDGSFTVYGGFGVDNFTGGSGAAGDGFFFGQGRFGSSDVINGGGGLDQLGLQGNFTGANAITFGAAQLTSVEFIVLLSAADTRFGAAGGTAAYQLTMNDLNVATGQQMVVSANTLAIGETFTFNGSAETNGSFQIFSGAGNDSITGSQNADEIYGGVGNDVLTGGAGNDVIVGGAQGDTLTGGAGNDVFRYFALTDSNSTERDGIQDFNNGDLIDLSRLDANSLLAGDQAFTFVGTSAFSGIAGELRYENISLGGPIWLVQADVNGDSISDFEIVLVISPADAITPSDFLF
ncbi:Calx-beta domain-containing protein [Sphingomonas sp. LY29]|uniref:Calx-beta domain-containing protein n=1 Tax=Sphingomonas sp. LY29 TaxID=3095341 RepID=UPI002D76DFCA|nr:Calx-beta domain-containing protein [Sphingomonas sp. LY29]WRP26360.1 Calx-beta domain-containing protein [Sphingomonas sp. LY29]